MPKSAEELRQASCERARRYRERHPDRVRASVSRWVKNNREQVKAARNLRRVKDPAWRLLSLARRRAKKASSTLDRIDNSRGYVKGNVQVISWRANRIKGDATVNELRKLLEYMTRE